jgi:hypothetical protein
MLSLPGSLHSSIVDEMVLPGGVGNAGLVVRIGDTVRRPWHPSTEATHAVLTYLNEVLPGVAPLPLGRDEQGREVLSYLPGEVAVEPFPAWAAGPDYLSSIGRLLRRVHDALANWRFPPGLAWSDELADPHGGELIVHADVCPENVITRDRRAEAIIDWEFAAPGRRIWDVVSTARLCVPFTHPSRREPVFAGADVIARLRTFLDAYQLEDADRGRFTEVLRERSLAGERFVRGRVARGEPAFVERWATPDGLSRLRVEQAWISAVPSDVARRW